MQKERVQASDTERPWFIIEGDCTFLILRNSGGGQGSELYCLDGHTSGSPCHGGILAGIV